MAGTRLVATGATLELYHQAAEADWNLEVTLDGPTPRLLLAGTVLTPALPGPSPLELRFVDDPPLVMLDGLAGWLVSSDEQGALHLVAEGDGARIDGPLRLTWTALDWGVTPSSRHYVLEVPVLATIVAR